MNKTKDLIGVITKYEEGIIDFAQAQSMIEAVCGKEVEQYLLDSYWDYESIEELSTRLAMEPIHDWKDIDDARAVLLVQEILDDPTNSAVLDRNTEALEKRYGKPEGRVLEIIFQMNLGSTKEILAELNRDTKIYL